MEKMFREKSKEQRKQDAIKNITIEE